MRFLFILTLFLSYISLSAQDNKEFCEQVSALNKLIQTEHYSPKPLDDSFSKEVHKLFVEIIDHDKKFFISNDLAMFAIDQSEIDNYIQNGNCDFINKYILTLTQRILDTKFIIKSLEKETFDYSGKDTLYFDADKSSKTIKDAAHLQRLWSKRLRYKTAILAIEEDSVFENVKSNFKITENQFKTKVIDRELCHLDEILSQNGGVDKFVKEAFLNALTTYQDPNSTFLDISDKKLFENSLSSNQLSFGINTEKNRNGDIIVAYITPGSAAYQNGNFEPNDIIQSLTSGNDILEAYCISNEDLVTFTNDEKHQTITFKIKKVDGSIHKISLTKSLLKVEENITRAYIIDGDIKLGYINIPSFYTDMETFNGLGLANDVAKELYKLKKELVDGLILDLRFNGGGSMKEATDLAGMFIDRGPISVLKYKNGDTFTVKDPNRGTLFGKPILILVNAFSASASEYLAGTMQDYHRAIIVGTPTHGKATAQVMLPLSNDKDLGFCKLTVEKFYRVTGQSHQSLGVIPDIKLPSLYNNFKTQEKFQEFALENDSIEAPLRFSPLKAFPINALKKESEQRITENNAFNEIKAINTQLVDHYINKSVQYPLTLDAIHQDISNYSELWKKFQNVENIQEPVFTVKNTFSTKDIIKYNNDEKLKNKETLDGISKDAYINEAYIILSSYIKLNLSH